jgi:exonuclease III
MSKIEKASESQSHFKGAVYEGQDFFVSEKEIEGEKYRIFHQASTGFAGTSGIRRSATRRANKFCQSKGNNKKMFTVSEHTAKPPYILGNFPRIEIIFVCLDDGKAQNRASDEKYSHLVKLKKLLDDGVLTQDEFNVEKQKVLSE